MKQAEKAYNGALRAVRAYNLKKSGRTLREVGRIMGIGASRVSQLIATAERYKRGFVPFYLRDDPERWRRVIVQIGGK